MSAIDLDMRMILVIRGNINDKPLNVIAKGLGRHLGETFIVENDKGDETEIDIDDLDTYLPLTGLWKKKYPDYEYYVSL